MFRKLSISVALFIVLAFGGAFSQGADASGGQNAKQIQYKMLYSINGDTGSLAKEDVNNLLQQAIERLQQKWQKKITVNQTDKKTERPEKHIETPKQPEQKAPVEKDKAEEPQKVTQEQPTESTEQEKEEVVTTQPEEEQVQPNEQKNEDKQDTSLSQFEVEVVELTNKERVNQGLQPLQIDEELSRVAREKSRDMATNNYFDHNSPVYGTPFDMMKSYDIDYRTAGENIAKGQRTPAEVVNAWMNSPGHRANILNGNFTHIGVGYLESGNHWTQMFIGK